MNQITLSIIRNSLCDFNFKLKYYGENVIVIKIDSIKCKRVNQKFVLLDLAVALELFCQNYYTTKYEKRELKYEKCK